MAFHVIDVCVRGDGAKGGWVTNGLENVFSPLAELTVDYANTAWRKTHIHHGYKDDPNNVLTAPNAWFLTVTVDHGMEPEPSTGDRSWYLPTLLAYQLGRVTTKLSTNKAHYLAGSEIYGEKGIVTRQSQASGGRTPWWANTIDLHPAAVGEMNYQCDRTLGTLRAADCSHLEFFKLGYSSDAFTIGPGAAKVVSFSKFNTSTVPVSPTKLDAEFCSITISSEISITITWAQVKAALDALINLCVSSSLQVGGTASYGLGHGTKVSTRDISGKFLVLP